MPAKYRPADHEGRVRARWEASGAFHADPGRVLRGEAAPYCIVIPPPNVTDRLHLGHALNNTLQDVLVRVHRMRGFETLWMPGTDHAGIATQAVVERRLRAEGKVKGPLREAMKREEFVAIVQSFKDEYEATITGQLRAMGCSCDWARQRFTMDEQCARAVYEAFFRLFRDGLIYRGKRLVNWDPVLQTAVSDDECEDVEVDGNFYYLRYPLVHGGGARQRDSETARQGAEDAVPVTWSELRRLGWPAQHDAEHLDERQAWVTVATTRPETYLGDTAVGVNPHDPRAKSLRGLSVELPLVGRIIPIIEDSYVVMPRDGQGSGIRGQRSGEEEAEDPKATFATGFLKVTPAHDPNDYEIGQRHGLPMINIFAPDATISDKHGWTDVGDAHLLVGLSREEARKKVVMEFKARGLCEKVVPYRHSVKHSDRSKAAIEPYLSDQWYVRVTDDRMAGAALRALASSLPTPSSGTGVPPVSTPSTSSSSGIPTQLVITARNLPHWQRGGHSYFVTFRLAEGSLSPKERSRVLSACRHWDGERLELHAAVVMPDHVHLVLSPFEKSPAEWWSLADLLHSIKSFTGHQIAKSRGTPGRIWQDESYDRIIRHDEYAETMSYVLENPVRARLVERWMDYPFTWTTDESRAGRLRFGERVLGVLMAGAKGAKVEGVDTGETPVPLEESRKAEAAGDGDLRFHPERYAKTYQAWHDGIRDWCISRQLWWGHRIPVWTARPHRYPGHDRKSIEREQETFASDLAKCLNAYMKASGTPDSLVIRALGDWEGAEHRVCICVREARAEGAFQTLARFLDEQAADPSALRPPDTSNTVPSPFANLERWSAADDVAKLVAAFRQDEDVLDTWFSSALWPLNTMGWPEETGLLRAFNPTDVLCTAREIITLWVSRMVMFERYLMPADWGETKRRRDEETKRPRTQDPGLRTLEDMGRGNGPLPFRDVCIHPLLMDGEGRKMSKMLGNGVDPLNIIETHGTDAMRFTLCQMTTHTQDVRMPVEKDAATGKNTSPKFDIGRNFCTKLWNAARFALSMLEQRDSETARQPDREERTLVDRWMLSRLAAATRDIDEAIAGYEFSDYAQRIYDLLWRDFCDWYLEAIKPTAAGNAAQRAVLAHAVEVIVRLLHPIAPFVTEAIWERLKDVQTDPVEGITLEPSRKDGLLCTAGWPDVSPSLRDEGAERQFERLRGLITAIREVRATHQVPPKRRVVLHVPAEIERECRVGGEMAVTLAGLERVTTEPPAGAAVQFMFEGVKGHLSNLADEVDAGAESTRLTKRITDLDKSITTLEARLANPGYVDRAPAAMVQQTKDQLAKAKQEREAAAATLAHLGSG